MSDRPVVRCPAPSCWRNQFMTQSGYCRRCGVALAPAPVPPKVQPDEPKAAPKATRPHWRTIRGTPYMDSGVPGQLRYIRNQRKLTHQALGDAVGCGRTYISRVENEKHTPTLKTLIRLAEALQVPVRVFWAAPDSRELVTRFVCLSERDQAAVVDRAKEMTK